MRKLLSCFLIENLLGHTESTNETSPTHRQTNNTPFTADAMLQWTPLAWFRQINYLYAVLDWFLRKRTDL